MREFARIFKPGDICKGGRYKIFDLLGAGGMCEVWSAFDEQAANYDSQWVAVKVLRSKLSFDKESTKRLEKEASTLLDVQHQNLVRVFHADVDEERNLFFYVMELLKGETLEARIKHTGGLPLGEALRLVIEIADATHGLHVLGIIHRDLKPDNVFVTNDGRGVLLDLGIAKFDPDRFPDRATQPTGPNTILGTCPYMSPEQCLGARLDARSDVYALGLIAYACIAGFHAAQGGPGGWMPHDYQQWTGWHLNNRPKPLSEVATWVPERVWEVISKALAKDPSERYASAEEFCGVLEGLLGWLKSHDLLEGLEARREPPLLTAEQALSLATTEEKTLGHSGSVACTTPPSLNEPKFREGVSAGHSVEEHKSPSTARGTEIITLIPADSAETFRPRTANGTEIIQLPPSRNTDTSGAAPDPEPRAKSGTDSVGSASQSTLIAHAVSVPSPQPPRTPRTPTRRVFAFGGAGVLVGMCMAIIAVLFRAPLHSGLASPPALSVMNGTASAPPATVDPVVLEIVPTNPTSVSPGPQTTVNGSVSIAAPPISPAPHPAGNGSTSLAAPSISSPGSAGPQTVVSAVSLPSVPANSRGVAPAKPKIRPKSDRFED